LSLNISRKSLSSSVANCASLRWLDRPTRQVQSPGADIYSPSLHLTIDRPASFWNPCVDRPAALANKPGRVNGESCHPVITARSAPSSSRADSPWGVLGMVTESLRSGSLRCADHAIARHVAMPPYLGLALFAPLRLCEPFGEGPQHRGSSV
jgi:hypothetical protein